ncbi:hypothetical protein FE257_006222 [Aspergillus nanangensis]|uniref:Uncharacterized protein n=1 Tax=Aspergillus nanangensis TaxID=2582783 RepID=A0AAD4CAA1_ASPNN|nr:hypothetical protein FE257_006222 [Aspergillus nanangensis]
MAHPEDGLDAPDGSSLVWILDHCLRYPGSYEIPLRTMYSLNCNPTRQPPPSNRPPETAFSHHSPKSSVGSSQDEPMTRAADFRAMLTHHVSQIRSQPCSLPPSFVTSFLRRCFTPRLEDVDFPQALTGLDYLRDLDIRRRKEIPAALQRLQVDLADLREGSEFQNKHPGVFAWIESIHAQNRKVEALYTQIYIGIRRWTLINEMLITPYNRANCIAMLNTLFPPVTSSTVTPTTQLTPPILKSQRDGFFRYISAIDKNGSGILDKVIAQGAPEGETNGWPLVRDALDRYLRATNDIIDECLMVRSPASVEVDNENTGRGHKGRKVDSGISFGSSERLPSTPSIHSSNSSEGVLDKPLPPFPGKNTPLKSGGSTLERLARELRRLGDAGKVKGLKKMRSTSALSSRSENLPTNIPEHESFFEVDEMKRKRLMWEATSRKRSHSKQPSMETIRD